MVDAAPGPDQQVGIVPSAWPVVLREGGHRVDGAGESAPILAVALKVKTTRQEMEMDWKRVKRTWIRQELPREAPPL